MPMTSCPVKPSSFIRPSKRSPNVLIDAVAPANRRCSVALSRRMPKPTSRTAATLRNHSASRPIENPTVAAKSHFGNLGGGSGLVECVGSVLAMRHGELFPLLNHEVADEACGIRPARRGDPAGEVFVSTAVTPQGQSGSLVIRSWQDSA